MSDQRWVCGNDQFENVMGGPGFVPCPACRPYPLKPTAGDSLVARPGDTLVVSFADDLTQERAYKIKERFHEELPGVKVVLVSRCTGLAVVQGAREFDREDLREFE